MSYNVSVLPTVQEPQTTPILGSEFGCRDEGTKPEYIVISCDGIYIIFNYFSPPISLMDANG
jgi:hypothetical protein